MKKTPPIAGNVFDKYGSRNPAVRLLVSNFLRTMTAMLQSVSVTNVLDVGCGEGYVLNLLDQRLRPQGAMGIDLWPDVLNKARACYPRLVFTRGSAERLPFVDQSFDLVVASEILEHLDNPSLAVEEIRRVTSRYSLFSVPNEPLWRALNMLRLHYVSEWGNTPGHLQHFSPDTFFDLLTAEFRILQWARPLPWLMALCERR